MPHCRPTYVDAAYCYRPSSLVCRSVGLSVSHGGEPCKTAEPIELPFGIWARVGSSNDALDGVQIPHGKGQF